MASFRRSRNLSRRGLRPEADHLGIGQQLVGGRVHQLAARVGATCDGSHLYRQRRRARKVAEEAQTKLERYLNTIEKGMDPALYVERSRAAQAALAAARAVLDAHCGTASSPLGDDELRGLLRRVGGIVGLLQDADTDERRGFYQEIGLSLVYQRVAGHENVTAVLGVEFSRVGGGTSPLRTRVPVLRPAAQ